VDLRILNGKKHWTLNGEFFEEKNEKPFDKMFAFRLLHFTICVNIPNVMPETKKIL
jgi:hypothetical protein